MEKKKELSDYIKEIRKRHNLTRKAFSSRLGVTLTYIYMLERPYSISKKVPSERLLRQIARLYAPDMERRLLLERVRLLAAPEVKDLID